MDLSYKAVIFDLDGTLVDSLDDLADSVNEVLRSYGYPTHPTESYKHKIGNGARMLLKRALPEGSAESLVDEALGKYKALYAQRFLIKTRPYDGILAVVELLRQRHIPLAICTNKHHEAAEAIVSKLFPQGTFQCVCGEQPNKPRKPAPDAVLGIAQALGMSPDEVVYIGDSEVDMQTGVNAGMLPVGVLWGFRDRRELEANGAKIILSSPAELMTKVKFNA